MFALGKIQTLQIAKEVSFGVYLSDVAAENTKNTDFAETVLLPVRQVPEGARVGDKVEVFLYKDSEDRLIATTKRPKLTLGEVGRLTVSQVTRIGAFLDWGLEKDLLLPYKEQTKPVQEQESVLVALYVDKSDRLCATMNVYPYLRQDSPYRKNSRVTGLVYETSDNFGAFVAVDEKYSALIPKKELYEKLEPGQEVSARVAAVKEDGRLDLCLREKAYLQMDTDAEKLLQLMEERGGVLPFTDKASPERIRQETQMSKNEFKRAVGHLLKERKILIEEEQIRRV